MSSKQQHEQPSTISQQENHISAQQHEEIKNIEIVPPDLPNMLTQIKKGFLKYSKKDSSQKKKLEEFFKTKSYDDFINYLQNPNTAKATCDEKACKQLIDGIANMKMVFTGSKEVNKQTSKENRNKSNKSNNKEMEKAKEKPNYSKNDAKSDNKEKKKAKEQPNYNKTEAKDFLEKNYLHMMWLILKNYNSSNGNATLKPDEINNQPTIGEDVVAEQQRKINKLELQVNALTEKRDELNKTLQSQSSATSKPAKNKGKNQPKTDKDLVSKQKEEIDELNAKLDALAKDREDLTKRLAAEMGNKLSANESSVENVTIKNRPMNIADEFSLFTSHEWLDAKSVLDDKCLEQPEHVKIQFLHNILKTSYDEADKAFTIMNDRFTETIQNLDNPTAFLSEGVDSRKENKPKPNSPKLGFKNYFGDHLRMRADNADLSGVVENVRNKMSMSINRKSRATTTAAKNLSQTENNPIRIWQKVNNEKAITEYVNKSVQITWKMVIQRPKMIFDEQSTENKGEKIQDFHWNSNPKGNKVIEVYPRLLHGGQAMTRAKIYQYDEDIERNRTSKDIGKDKKKMGRNSAETFHAENKPKNDNVIKSTVL